MTAQHRPYVRHGSVWVVAVASFVVVSISIIAVDMWLKGAAVHAILLAVPNIVGYAIVAAPLFGLPATLIGAFIAHRQLVSQPARRPLSAWVSQGAVVGALLGAVNCGVWLGLLFASSRPALDPRIFVVGAVPGLIVGIAVAAWCWRLSASA